MYKFKLILSAAMVFWIGAVTADHLKGHTIENRIKPSGSVYQDGDDVPVAKPVVVENNEPRNGKDIYGTKCVACHATEAIGAPMFGNAASWKDRIAKGEATLIENAIIGINAMPPMGTCMDCSKDEIKLTVLYMIENSQ